MREWEVQTKDCQSGYGAIPQYNGALVLEKGEDGVRLQTQQPNDEISVAFLWSPQTKKSIMLDKNVCRIFDLKQEWQSVFIQEVQAIRGSLHFDCKLPTEERIQGDIIFANCH